MRDCDTIGEHVSNSMDVRGLFCSKPIIKVKIFMRKMKPEDTLEVLADEKNVGDIKRVFRGREDFRVLECPEPDHVRLYVTRIAG